MRKVVLAVAILGLSLVASAQAGAASAPGDEYETDSPPPADSAADASRAARAYTMLPFVVSPRVGDQAVAGHFWGGYDGATRGAVGEAVVDGRLTRFLALRAGASSSDLSGRSTAILGATVGILRDGTAPFDLGVGAFYQPQSIRGDGLVTATVSAGKTIGRLSSYASLGYGQDPEGDDGVGVASLGAVFRVRGGLHTGFQSRTRFQLWSHDGKFDRLAQPSMDFSAGPLLAYSLGTFDIMAQGGIAGLMLKEPPEAIGERTRIQLGPMVMFGIGAAL